MRRGLTTLMVGLFIFGGLFWRLHYHPNRCGGVLKKQRCNQCQPFQPFKFIKNRGK